VILPPSVFYYANAFNGVFAVGSGQGGVIGDDVNGRSSNEVAIHTDDRTIGQLVVGKGLLLGCELAEFSPQGFNG
jgi:hypothetical protein